MQQEEMSFWDHLEELRWTLFRAILALFIFAIAGFAFMPYLFDKVVLAPTTADFVTFKMLCKVSSLTSVLPDFCNQSYHVEIMNIKLASQFFTHMTTSFWLALLLTFPYLMYEVWKFVSPALYENEKKNIRWVFTFGTMMFFLGCAVGYFMVFPMTLRFLATYQLSAAIEERVSLESYMDNFYMLIFIMGVVFEMPLVSWLLSKLGLINRSFFHKYRRHAVVFLLVGAAFITPSSDPFTLGIVFFPLYGLYELSAFFVKKAPKEDEDEEEDDSTQEPVNA
ncbi:twin-arginine translocase subunit TatC [Massilibacteroides sp.]|uniref:twin-arginine translocase subunit TatC n=1 Tax=Massilibacteroides sp. TaxID=2034766 RepID=UPI00261BC82A|nr:twin-arginine translocase subunit TatC [Massilibacteroides sp.]MDD4515572.1 twin-arginine translocase subunit TatC [Massilibacteroides sp.]